MQQHCSIPGDRKGKKKNTIKIVLDFILQTYPMESLHGEYGKEREEDSR
jgi:hypothetical protein